VLDYLVKISGIGDLREEALGRMPHFLVHSLEEELILRALRLNCLTADYGRLWETLFRAQWQEDLWTSRSRFADCTVLGAVRPRWVMSTPLRKEVERWQALVEIDALAAVMLGISAEELCAIYRTQFGVLRKYERVMQFDRNGRQVPKDVLKEYEKHGTRADLGRYELPFTGVNREAEMTIAHEEFSRRAVQRGAHQSGVGVPSQEVSE
jgi:hypothetical protein